MFLRQYLFIIFMIFTLSVTSYAKETSAGKGLRLAKELEVANRGFVGEEAEMEMILVDAYKSKTVRQMSGKTMEINGDGDKSLMVFKNPKDVKGTKMLTHTHKKGDDDQWLFLPSLRRVKRISSRSKTSSFMGSEFSYEDLGSQEIDKYNFNWIKDVKNKKGDALYILERKPKKKSGYSKMVMTISRKLKSAVKIDYFDKKGDLLKTGMFKNFKLYKVGSKKIYRAGLIEMKNVQTKKSSIFTWKSRKLGVKHRKRDFNKNSLK
jgi:hypothetical protein